MKHRQMQTQNKQIHETNDKQARGEIFTVRPVCHCASLRQAMTNTHDDKYTR